MVAPFYTHTLSLFFKVINIDLKRILRGVEDVIDSSRLERIEIILNRIGRLEEIYINNFRYISIY